MKSFRHLLILTIFATLFTACHKDSDSNDKVEPIDVFTATVVQEINGTIVGMVINEQNQPVEGAIVQIYSASVVTNKFGVFLFKNAKVDKNGTYVRVQKSGYILSSDFVYPDETATTYSRIKLMSLETNKLLDAGLGGTILATNGGKIEFLPNSIANADGSLHKGTVSVTAKYLNPHNNDIGDLMPGGMTADETAGNTVVLGTLGMMAVELRDTEGNELNLMTGSKATIHFPAVTDNLPASIKLWSFDELKGRWKEEGEAGLIDGHYIGSVTHFSFWNCDAPFPLVEVCGKVVSKEGTPIPNIGIQVTVEGFGASWGSTNSEGEFCGKMPKGKVLKFKILFGSCPETFGSFTVGPFDNNTVLDDFVIENIEQFIIKGSINCNASPVAEGVAIIKVDSFRHIVLADENGKFEVNLTQYTCNGQMPVIKVFGYDNATSQASATIAVTNVNASNIMINVCSNPCDFTGVVDYTCGPIATVILTGGSGNFAYEWQGYGIKEPSINISGLDSVEGGELCVIVTDLGSNNCQRKFCKTIPGSVRVYGEINCDIGEITARAFQGTTPYKYAWSNGSTAEKITGLAEGIYKVVVTDANGCTASAQFQYLRAVLDPNVSSCSKERFSIISSPFDSGYLFGQGIVNNNVQFPINLSVFETGFNFSIQISSAILNGSVPGCTALAQYSLPRLIDGLTANSTATTCNTCIDGKITYSLNTTAVCTQCTIGSVKVFKDTDLNTDLIGSINGNLAKGNYYVVVTDATSGCYIAFKKVQIL